MPRGRWSRKDERMYKHIMEKCVAKQKRRSSFKTCERIAAATVNKLRKKQGRTLSGLSGCGCDY
jgi:hypothetical protein